MGQHPSEAANAIMIIPSGLALPAEPANTYPPTGTASLPASPTIHHAAENELLIGLMAGSIAMTAMIATALMGGSLL